MLASASGSFVSDASRTCNRRRCERLHDLSRIHDPVWVEGMFDRAHRPNGDAAVLGFKKMLLALANSVLAGSSLGG